VIAIMASGIVPTSIELLDRLTMQCVEENRRPRLAGRQRRDAAVRGRRKHEASSTTNSSASPRSRASTARPRRASRATHEPRATGCGRARRAVSPALARKRPHKLGEDISVPRSELVAMVRAVREIAARHAC
jgi:glycolate oxidase